MSKITKQQAFETAVNGLLAQGAVSTDNVNDCLYRGIGGLKCGIGFLIPDNVYQDHFEKRSASGLFDNPEFKELFDNEVKPSFLDAMQRELHDQFIFASYNKGIPYKEWLMGRSKDFACLNNLVLPKIVKGEVS